MGALVDARATWHAPDALTVDEPASLGLSIGDTEDLRRQIELNLPDLPVRDAGVLQVGDNVSAELIADRASLAVQPDSAIDASFGSQPGLLYTWTVRPLQPAAKLQVHVHLTMTVPGTNHVLVRDIPLTLRVDRGPCRTRRTRCSRAGRRGRPSSPRRPRRSGGCGAVARAVGGDGKHPSHLTDAALLVAHESNRPVDPAGRTSIPTRSYKPSSGPRVGRQLRP